MKRLLSSVCITVIAAFLFSSCKSKEDKVLDLVSQYMKTILYDYDSYEVNSCQIDSAYSTVFMNATVRKKAENIIKWNKELTASQWDLERAEDDIDTYAPYPYCSSYWTRQYNKAKEKKEKVEKQIIETNDKISDAKTEIVNLYNNHKVEYIGWQAVINYRCKTQGGLTHICVGLFVVNPEINKIMFCIPDCDEEQLEIINTIKDALGINE